MNEEISIPKAMRALVSLLLNLKKCGLFFLVSLCLQLVTVSGSAQFTKLLDMGSNGAYPNGSLYFDGTFLFGVTNLISAAYQNLFKFISKDRKLSKAIFLHE